MAERPAGSVPPPDYAALRSCVVRAGVLLPDEFDASVAAWSARLEAMGTRFSIAAPLPYILTGAEGALQPGACAWGFDARACEPFAAWCMGALAARFGLTWEVHAEQLADDVGGDAAPHLLRLAVGGQVEHCDWRYLNTHRWAGAFCTIANRLLEPHGVCLVELETGWYDVVLCLCWAQAADELLSWFGEAE